MSPSRKPIGGRSGGGLEKGESSGARNMIGVSQSDSQSVEEYKVEFLDKADNLGLLNDEMLLVRCFRDGLREEIRRQVPETNGDSSMDVVIERANLVEHRLENTIPEVSVDKHMVSCATDEDEPESSDPEEDPAEDEADEDNANNDEDMEAEEPGEEEENEDMSDDSLHGDYHTDSRYWVYDDLDQWGVGTLPH